MDSEVITREPQESGAKKSGSAFWSPVITIFLVVMVYFVSQIFANTVFNIFPAVGGWGKTQTQEWFKTTGAQFGYILLIEASVVAAVWWLLRLKKASLRKIGLKKFEAEDLLFAFIALGVYIAVFAIVVGVVSVLFPGLNIKQKQEIGFESVRTGLDLIMVFLSLVVLPPIAEEILCRGYLYTGLRSRLPVWAAGVIASALFAAAHLQAWTGKPLLWIAAVDTFTLSLVLVYLREKTGSLSAPIILHMLKNTIAFVMLFVLLLR